MSINTFIVNTSIVNTAGIVPTYGDFAGGSVITLRQTVVNQIPATNVITLRQVVSFKSSQIALNCITLKQQVVYNTNEPTNAITLRQRVV